MSPKEPLLSDRESSELSESLGPIGDPQLPPGSNNQTASPPASAGNSTPFNIDDPITPVTSATGTPRPAADLDADENKLDSRVLAGSTKWRGGKTKK